MAKIQQDVRDQMLESQRSMMDQLTRLLAGGLEKGKSPIINNGDDNEDPVYPPWFVPRDVRDTTRCVPKKAITTIVPKPFQTVSRTDELSTVRAPIRDNPTNHVVLNLDEESLVGAASRWYNQLSRNQISSWRDLAQAFMKHAENPLPNHGDKGINAIIESSGKEIKMNVAEVNTPLKEVWKKIGERGLMAQNSGVKPREAKNYCEFHDQEDHEIQKCSQFRALVQGLMDNKELEFFEYVKNQEEVDVCASEEGSTRNACEINHPLVIISHLRTNEDGTQVTPKVVIQKPVAFPYKDSKRVPWNYSCNVTIPGKKSPASASQENQDVGFFTRSGRRYVPEGTGTKIVKEKVPTVEQRKEKMVEFESPVNESVTENEAREFLKFLKHSEYSIVEQLHKQPARISVLALLLSSETHRSALMKVLNETYVAHDISVNKLDRLVNNISADNFIFFNDNEIPLGGMGSTKALHITTRCKGYTLPGVLIDNGSALNVLPLSTLNRLPVDSSHMKTCQNVVRAFDGTERNVMGRIELPLQIGPSTYEIDFLVMDIKPSYNCLLGRPWIHSAGAVSSSLHQKLKLITEGRLVTINAEEDIIASLPRTHHMWGR
ncbi:uncharacterized protein LOC128282155 [Gossypium arboreum]|uniref:uncharacterized protein LOC128282155 n=1 Tax=Gossypium arboreum TaxID=29729 RepID=UPI0022F16A00|nr:uncharacterized protein LOC128282155 [Gossypium arboreum]